MYLVYFICSTGTDQPKTLIGCYNWKNIQGVQKVKCTSCGTMFMSETETNTCPTCSENLGHAHEDIGGCGCGHSH